MNHVEQALTRDTQSQAGPAAVGGPERRRSILVNPAHGNEPYILGAKMAVTAAKQLHEQGVEGVQVVIPLLYPQNDRQKNILLSTLGEDARYIYLDKQLGQILQKILFGSNDFPGHLRRVLGFSAEVQKEIAEHFANGFSAENIADGTTQAFKQEDVIASIDTGTRVLFPAQRRYSAFPALFPEVLTGAKQEKLPLGLTDTEFIMVMERVNAVEDGYDIRFIPRIHTFSYATVGDTINVSSDEMYNRLQQDSTTRMGNRRVVYTPPMKNPSEGVSNELDNGDGVFVVYSGTNSVIVETTAAAKSAEQAGLHVYDNRTVLQDPTRIIADPRIKVVISRSGQGTGWQVYLGAKPWLVTEYRREDDPEIFFNNKTVTALHLGEVITSELPEDLRQQIEKVQALKEHLLILRQRQQEEFGTLDGIEFMAKRIVKELLQARDEGRV